MAERIVVAVAGQEIECDAILMHSAAGVRKWQQTLASAQAQLGGFSSGIGVWGSPGVALAGAAVIGFLESAVSDAKQKLGLGLLAEATAYFERLRLRGSFVPVQELVGTNSPFPNDWSASGEVESEVTLANLSNWERKQVISEHSVTAEEERAGVVVRKTVQDLIVLPSEFVTAQAGGHEIAIRWSEVGSYRLA